MTVFCLFMINHTHNTLKVCLFAQWVIFLITAGTFFYGGAGNRIVVWAKHKLIWNLFKEGELKTLQWHDVYGLVCKAVNKWGVYVSNDLDDEKESDNQIHEFIMEYINTHWPLVS